MAKLPSIGNCPHNNPHNNLGRVPDFNGLTCQYSHWHRQKWWSLNDCHFMALAMQQAKLAADCDEVPVGAVLVHQNQLIGHGHNCPIHATDPTAHAEIMALRNACTTIGNYRLPPDTTLYVTLEPCTMCVGAFIHARLSRLVFATFEPRSGMLGSQLNLAQLTCYNHRIQVQHGLMQEQSRQLLQNFFRQRRQKK